MSRQVDREHASGIRYIAHGEDPAVCFHALPANGQSKPQARSIGAALLEWLEHVFSRAWRQSATCIFDVDPNAVRGGVSGQSHRGVLTREFERVLQEIPDDFAAPRKSDRGPGNDEILAKGASVYASACSSCHGNHGEGDAVEAVPMLAGQHPGYLLRQMYDAVDERRPTLARLHSERIKPLDFEQLHAVAEFLSQLGVVDSRARAR